MIKLVHSFLPLQSLYKMYEKRNRMRESKRCQHYFNSIHISVTPGIGRTRQNRKNARKDTTRKRERRNGSQAGTKSEKKERGGRYKKQQGDVIDDNFRLISFFKDSLCESVYLDSSGALRNRIEKTKMTAFFRMCVFNFIVSDYFMQ